jgi:enterochelin esterase-like enzyme
MDSEVLKMMTMQRLVINSSFLGREVLTDLYVPVFHKAGKQSLPLLLINDGQDLEKMPFDQMLDGLMAEQQIAANDMYGHSCCG